MVCKACQMSTVFLARHRLRLLSLLDVEDLNHLILARSDEKVTHVIKIERRDMRLDILFCGTAKQLCSMLVSCMTIDSA